MTLGERIKTLRKKEGLGIRELGRRAGIPHGNIVQLEQGSRTDVTTETAKRLARALHVSVDYLVGMYEESETGLEPAALAIA